jgi:hypothetical protein
MHTLKAKFCRKKQRTWARIIRANTAWGIRQKHCRVKIQASNWRGVKSTIYSWTQIQEKENDEIFRSIAEQEKELKQELADLPKYDPALVANSVESMANTLHLIPNKIEQSTYVKMVAKILGQNR